MLKTLKKLRYYLKSKEAHFLYIDSKSFNKLKFLIFICIFFNKNYKWCQIRRHAYKNHKNIVVFALRWYGKNVKRRTNGYAKEMVSNGEAKICIYCGTKLNKDNATAEHIIPLSNGGNNTQVNLITCCKFCNNERGDTDFSEYLFSKRPYLKGKKFFI